MVLDIDQLQNLVTAPSRNMETRLINANCKILLLVLSVSEKVRRQVL